MDGKTIRDRRHLLAAFDHSHSVVLGQVEVGAKTNEIPMFSTLLDRLTSPAPSSPPIPLHAQRDHATYLARRGAQYLLIVKRNQSNLYAQLAALPWRDVPVACDKRERGHGRTERHTVKVTAVKAGLAFPTQRSWPTALRSFAWRAPARPPPAAQPTAPASSSLPHPAVSRSSPRLPASHTGWHVRPETPLHAESRQVWKGVSVPRLCR
jgi:hypothetical protein